MKARTDHIFDVGANEGIDGLAQALYNRDCFIHAFEPNPELIKTIKKLKKKIELKKGVNLDNYKIYKCAVSDKNNYTYFYISKNHRVSSLNRLSNEIDNSWPGYKNSHFKVIKKIKIKVINLYDFIVKNNIKNIRYLKIDTQGNDLKVLKGLKSAVKIVSQGKFEIALNLNRSAYKNVNTLKDAKKFFLNSPLKIIKIKKIEHISNNKKLYNEADVYFKNRNFEKTNNLSFNYNNRYFYRLLNNKRSLKDKILDFFIRAKNLYLN